MKNLFEQILKKYRMKSGITQEFMVDLLSNNSSNLKKLDNVTFSRWERGITIPPFRKQIEIYRLLGVDPIDEIIELDIDLPQIEGEDYVITDYYTDSVNEFYSYCLNRTNIDEAINFIGEIELIKDGDVYISRLFDSFKLDKEEHVTQMMIEKFNAEIIICKYKKRIIAHSITLDIEPDFIKDLVSNSIDLSKIESYSGSNPFVISFHASTLTTLKFIIGNVLNKFLDIPNLESKLYMASFEKNIHKLFVKLKSKVKYNEIYNGKNHKISELTKFDINSSREALYFLVGFRRKEYEK